MKNQIEKLMQELLMLIANYPDYVQELRTLSTVAQYFEKYVDEKQYKKILSIDKNEELNENKLEKSLKKLLDIHKEIEKKIEKEESQIKFDFTTYNFNIDKVLNHSKKLESIMDKITYLEYIKKEYPNHLIRRNNTRQEILNKLILKSGEMMKELSEIQLMIFPKLKNKLNLISMIELSRTFEEKINDELKYLKRLSEIPKNEQVHTIIWNGNKIDILELAKLIAESKNIELINAEGLLKDLYYFFKIPQANEQEISDFIKSLRKKDLIINQAEVQNKPMREERMLSINDICEIFSVSRTTVYNWRKKELLNYKRINRKIYILESDVKKLLNNKSKM